MLQLTVTVHLSSSFIKNLASLDAAQRAALGHKRAAPQSGTSEIYIFFSTC